MALQVVALSQAAVEIASEAAAMARTAKADFEDSGEARDTHDSAAGLHLLASRLHRTVVVIGETSGSIETRVAHDSAAARHRAAAAAHGFAVQLAEASAGDPTEDGVGTEAIATATKLALGLSQRALDASRQA